MSTDSTRHRREPLADRVADALLERVRSGEWALGAKLPGETTLGPQMGVGRSTLREAIRQLAGRGVLQARQGAGVFVIALDVGDDWGDVVRTADIVEVIESRVAIESEAAALAAERRSPQALRTIRRSLAKRTVPGLNLDAFVDADMGFHRDVVAAADNAVLLELFVSFVPRLRSTMIDMLRMRRDFDRDQDHRAHEELVAAIAARDADAARLLSREHLRGLAAGLRGGRRR